MSEMTESAVYANAEYISGHIADTERQIWPLKAYRTNQEDMSMGLKEYFFGGRRTVIE